ncbi:tape measure protein [Mesorhizobium sp. CAU 1732]|uniref:tape measure protein n=1 Tax=Mesorhizobium sp. CAU 1732 TaxID=3140358 RepID=UPI0032601C0E
MAVTVEELRAVMRMEMKPFMRDLQQMNGVSSKAARQVEQTWRNANRRLDGIGKNMARSLIAPMAGIGAALGARELIRLTDTWTDLNSRVSLAAGGMEKGAEVMGRLGEVARRTYSSLEQTAEGYLLNATAMRELGYSTSQTLDYTESVNNALVISGAKGQRAASVMDALSKAMAIGKLSGDDLNTVISTGGRLAEALAEGLGVTVNELRTLGSQGKITGRDIVSALSSQMEKLRKEAADMPATISDGVQLLQNALLEYVGNADQATGVSAKISEALVIMADNFDKTADVALQLASVIAGALIGRSLLKMISTLGLAGSALVRFTQALTAARTMASLSVAFTGLGAVAGPVGLLIGGAVVSSLVLFSSSTSDASAGADRFAARLEALSKKAEDAAVSVEAAGERFNEALKNALGHEVAAAADQFDEAHAAAVRLFSEIIDNAPRRLVNDEQLGSLEDLRDELERDAESAEEVKNELFALANANPNFQGLADQMQPLLDRLALVITAARQAKAELASVNSDPNAEAYQQYGASRVAGNAIQAEREAYEKDAMRRAKLGKDQLAIENEISRVREKSIKDGVQLTEDQIKRIAEANLAGNAGRSAEGKKPPKERADEYERLAERITEATAAQVAETEVMRGLNPLVDDYGYAVERARAEQELLNAALKAGKEITPELKAEIAGLANEYATATVEAAKLGESQDEIRRKAEEMQEFQKDLTRGIVDGLIQGKKAADIFAEALTKVGNKLLDMAFNAAFTPPGGGGFNFLSLLGLGGGVKFSGAPGLWSEGGYTGPGGKNQPAGVVHKGEVVWSQADVAAAGGVGIVEAMRRGYANGGPVGITAPTMPRLQAPANQNGPSVTYAPQIDARGASVEAVARLEQVIAKDKAEFSSRVLATVSKGQKGRHKF